MTFSGKICFPSKGPEFLHVLFDEVVKHSPCIFLAGLHFVSEKKRRQNIEACTMNTTKLNKSI